MRLARDLPKVPIVQRPIRIVAITFGCLLLLLITFAPLLPLIEPTIEPATFLGWGALYSLFLSIAAVGLLLNGLHLLRFVHLISLVFAIGLIGFGLNLDWIEVSSLATLEWKLTGLWILVGVYGLQLLSIAAIGWIRYFWARR